MREEIIEVLKKTTGEREINLELPQNSQFGDFSTNICLRLGKNPREYAEELKEKLEKDQKLKTLVEKIEIAGPGFLNFYLKEEALLSELEKIDEKKERYGESEGGKGKTVVIDYSAPNIAKRFGIGHLRSTVIGQSLYNLYKTLGYKTIGDNHLGDWGTQFGVLLYQIVSKNLDPKRLDIEELERLYVEFHQEEEKDPSLHEKAKEWFKKLEEGDKEAKSIWKTLIDTSMVEFERVYRMLGIKIDYAYGESFYEEYMPQVIKEIRSKGISKKSEGAEIIEFDSLTPAMLVKADGTTTYFTRDLATIKFRLGSWNPDLFIYEVGNDQALHFRQIFETVKLLGWAKDKKFVHVNHGLIRFDHGKMSTRQGKTIKLEEVINEAIKRAKELGSTDDEVAQKVGVGAIIYWDLSHQPTTDIVFDWEKMFLLEGNSGPYLQYTVARSNSVLEKSEKEETGKLEVKNEAEKSLLRLLIQYPEVIESAAKAFSPNLLCNYLFNLAQEFNAFYAQNRVIGGDNFTLRLNLVKAVNQVLNNGLAILSISTPERM